MKKSIFTGVKEYVFITLGILIYVLGWSTFLVPNQLVGGGVTGLSSIIQYATRGGIKMGYSYFVLNGGLLIAALFTLGRSFGVKTVYATFLASVGLNVFQDIIPMEFVQTLAIDNGKLMSTIMGGLMVGVGVGMAMSQGGSTGGTDIIALIVNKYRNISPGKMLLAADAVIIVSSLFVPSYMEDGSLLPFTDKITTVVYGFILVAITGTVTDMVLSGSKQSVQLMIFSKKYEEIANGLTRELHRGVTVLNGKGWYSQENTEVVVVVARKYDLSELLHYIKLIDPDAFLSVSSVTGVYGKGFETIKSGRKK